jgi:hypothetical protein
MAIDLKPYFDAAQKADEDVQRLMADMHASFNDGTEEGKAKALEMRPQLDAAKDKAVEANKLYISMRNAGNVGNEAARNFVPVVDTAAGEQEADKKEMKRADFELLDAKARMAHIQGGGTVVD